MQCPAIGSCLIEEFCGTYYQQGVPPCASKLEEVAPSASANTGSPKLPGWEDVSNEIRRHRTYTHPGAELVDLGIAKIVYDFIARQLRADA